MSGARLNRRDFVRAAALSSAALCSPRAWGEVVPWANAELIVRPDRPGAWIPPDFVGLSYESAQLRDPQFFSGDNTQLIGFFRRLGYGVLRLGGNTSEYCYWAASPGPPASSAPEGAAKSISKDRATPMGFAFTGQKTPAPVPITPDAIRHLRDFLDATGWSLIYGLNMGTGKPEDAAAEAAFVGDVMGSKLVAFQFANEPDLFHRNGLRKPDYDYPQFAAEWRRLFHAVRARVPRAPFAGPDSASNLSWPVQFAREFRGAISVLTHHYYAEGPPSDPRMTIEHLLNPDPRLAQLFQEMRAAQAAATARQADVSGVMQGVPWRLAETNSCYQGGKQGVSDTFASALWAADLMFQVAASGGSGINFHGGGYGWYTPIAGSLEDGFSARPEYHGMLLFAQAAAGRFVEAEIQPSNSAPLLSAYAARSDGGALKIVLINKDAHRSARVSIRGTGAHRASILRLRASRLDATAGVTFGGTPVGAAGAWSPAREESLAVADGTFQVEIPAASAALITSQ